MSAPSVTCIVRCSNVVIEDCIVKYNAKIALAHHRTLAPGTLNMVRHHSHAQGDVAVRRKKSMSARMVGVRDVSLTSMTIDPEVAA